MNNSENNNIEEVCEHCDIKHNGKCCILDVLDKVEKKIKAKKLALLNKTKINTPIENVVSCRLFNECTQEVLEVKVENKDDNFSKQRFIDL
jgi:hypothetical protein